ncbi:MAG: type IV pilus twitching motility protein PilT [Campylobacterales bacterium]|nr:type IV pilus twitching motility protein PilT [Campylobacterales bacterium]
MNYEIDIKTLLKALIACGSSDLHLVVGYEPLIRIDGELKALDVMELDADTVQKLCYSIITGKQKKVFEESGELDFAIDIKDVGRFRVNYCRSFGNIAAAFRVVPSYVPSLDELGAPTIYKELVKRGKGLILVTGPTGSGKSTTLAAMLNEINTTESKHIITIEDPIEFVHGRKKSVFTFREVGSDTVSFATALKYSLRQDPDVILIGEMRDKETISAALTAAETGHMVFATLHTNSAPGTINRIIDVFSGDEQDQIRAQLAISLVAVISQVLVPKIDGGRLAISEIMINNNAIANLIRTDKVHQIYSQMELNYATTGMQTQIREMAKYYQNKMITMQNALKHSNNPIEFMQQISQ